jgi:hypothetical protein
MQRQITLVIQIDNRRVLAVLLLVVQASTVDVAETGPTAPSAGRT